MTKVRHTLRWLLRACAITITATLAVVAASVALTPLPEELREAKGDRNDSVRVLDREGRVLREVRADDHARAVAITREELGDVAERALVAAEDRRFYWHPGVDPIAVVRAFAGNVGAGRITSGASTISMQLARILRPHPRTFAGKVREALLALRIEASLSKDRILLEYANRAPFGPGIRGIGAAARTYFDRAPSELSIGEAALLASIPRGPSLYDPQRRPRIVAARRERILERMRAFGLIDDAKATTALAEPATVLARERPLGAMHFVAAVLDGRVDGSRSSRAGVVATTLDGELQAEVERAVMAQVFALRARHVTAGAALVVDHRTGEVLAWVGSPNASTGEAGGFNDGVQARRQAGSTLKPFLYGLALDRREIDPATVLADVALTLPLKSGSFVPGNYDGKFHGPVRARVALASSLNVPAVALAERVGIDDLLTSLHEAGFALPESPDHYGAALALGDGEVTLLELVRAYAALARGGERIALRATKGELAAAPSARIMSERAAWRIADMLADKEARLPAFGERNVLEMPFRASVKTGTSKGFRDNWAVGFTERFTAGVWVGNFDGSSMREVSGVTGAGPLLRSVLAAAEQRGARTAPANVASPSALGLVETDVCALSGELPGEGCTHRVHEWLTADERSAKHTCAMHVTALVERASGKLASPRCTAPLVRRTFEDYPRELVQWARESGRPLLPEASPRCPPQGASSRDDDAARSQVRIEHPAPSSRYYLERDRAPAAIDVRVSAPADAGSIALEVDGRIVARASAGSPIAWRPPTGRHTLVAVTARRERSEPILVDVE